MDFSTIKADFFEKLNKQLKMNNQKTVKDDDDMNLFRYSNEFKNYLVDNDYADRSIFTKSVNDILSLDFEDGKFVLSLIHI